MTLSGGQVSLGVHPDTTGFGSKLHEGVMAESGGLFGLGKELGGHLMAGLGTIGIAVGVGEFVKKGVEEYASADALNAQFTAGIASTGNAANLSVKGMDDLAKSIAGYSGQSFESIGKTEQVLQTFTNLRNVGPDKIFDDATTAAANMAAKLGGDASASAVQLGKALNDPVKGVTALQRVGVSFTQAQKDSIAAMVQSGDTMGAQKLILTELNTEFGGAAKAAGQTLPGEVARSKVAFGELSKAVLSGVLPLLTPLIGSIADGMNKAVPHIEHFGEIFTEKLRKGEEAVHGLFDLLVKGDFTHAFREAFHVEEDSPVVGVLLKVHEGAGLALQGVKDFFAGFTKGVDAVGTNQSPLAHWGAAAYEGISKMWEGVKPIFEQLGKLFEALWPTLAPLIPQILTLASSFSPLSLVLKAIGPVMPVIVEAIEKLAQALGGALTQVLPIVVSLVGTLVSSLSGVLADILPVISSLIGTLADSVVSILPTIGILAHVIGDVLAAALPTVATLIKTLVPIVASLLPPILQVVNVLLAVLGPVLQIVGSLLISIINIILPVLVPVIQFLGAVVTVVFQVIGNIVSWLWTSVIQPVAGFVVAAFQGIGAVASWLWNNAIQPALNGIGAAWNWLWNTVIAPLVGFFVDAFNNIGKAVQTFWAVNVQPVINAIGAIFKWLWDSILWPIIQIWILAFTLVGLGAQWLWNNAIMPVVNFIVSAFQLLGSVVAWLWDNAIQPAINAIGAAWNWLWDNVIQPVVNFIVGYFQMLGSIASWLWNNAIQPAINSIGDAWNWLWNNVIMPVGQYIHDKIQAIGDTIGSVFGSIGDTIRNAFNGVVSFIRGIINDVIDVVNGAIGSINDIAGAVKTATGGAVDIHLGLIPHLASGGVIQTPGTALVGENGPELVTLPAGATVYPSGTGPATGNRTEVNFNGPVYGDPQHIVDEMEARRRRAATLTNLSAITVGV